MKKLTFIDFEFVGACGLGMDLGAFVISAFNPEQRRLYEKDLVRTYYENLVASGKVDSDYTYEKCFNDYVMRGASRALVYMVLLTAFTEQTYLKYWHDHCDAFVKDHNLNAENIMMPEFAFF